MESARAVQQALKRYARPDKAKASAWFFKTNKGQYGYGDEFIGVTVPEQRIVAKQFQTLSLPEIAKLLKSPIHEHRLTALLILTYQYPRVSEREQKRITQFYLKHHAGVNNWDLVDLSAPNILGARLLNRPAERNILRRYARSRNLWERRIAIVATYAFIRAGEYRDTLRIAAILMDDEHDLIHKAVGWMLREVGKKDQQVLERFLDRYASRMPRTMLRYAIERMGDTEKRRYMQRS